MIKNKIFKQGIGIAGVVMWTKNPYFDSIKMFTDHRESK